MPLTSTLTKFNFNKSEFDTLPSSICHLNGLTSSGEWRDNSGNSNNFTLYNSPTISDTKIITFNGSSHYAKLTTNLTPTFGSNFSVFMWIKTTSTSAYLFSIGRSETNYQGIIVFQIDSSGKLLLWDYNTNNGFDSSISSINTINDGYWHMVGFVKNGTTGTYYVDGIANGTKTASSDKTYDFSNAIIGYDERDKILINYPKYFTGSIKQFIIYNSALSATNIQTFFNLTKDTFSLTKTNLIFWYDARNQDPNSLTIIDNSTNAKNGTLKTLNKQSNGTNFYFNFTGSTDSNYIRSPNIRQSLVDSSWNQTQEVWFRTLEADAGVIIDETDNTYGNSGWHESQLEVYQNKLKFRVWNTAIISDSTIVSDGNWHHAVWRYKSSGLLEGFVDGIKCTVSSSGTRQIPNTYYAWIGMSDWTKLGNGNYFTGDVAIYRNYNVALTDEQILANYNSEKDFFN